MTSASRAGCQRGLRSLSTTCARMPSAGRVGSGSAAANRRSWSSTCRRVIEPRGPDRPQGDLDRRRRHPGERPAGLPGGRVGMSEQRGQDRARRRRRHSTRRSTAASGQCRPTGGCAPTSGGTSPRRSDSVTASSAAAGTKWSARPGGIASPASSRAPVRAACTPSCPGDRASRCRMPTSGQSPISVSGMASSESSDTIRMPAVRRDPQTAAEGDAALVGDDRLRVAGQGRVHVVLVGQERHRLVGAVQDRLAQGPDVRAGAQSALAAPSISTTATCGSSTHRSRRPPDAVDHRQGQRVDLPRPVQGDPAEPALDADQQRTLRWFRPPRHGNHTAVGRVSRHGAASIAIFEMRKPATVECSPQQDRRKGSSWASTVATSTRARRSTTTPTRARALSGSHRSRRSAGSCSATTAR